jgi:phosphatidylserine/phosphatidylglycerophosphate/cardiolipin synthase-like enzyme
MSRSCRLDPLIFALLLATAPAFRTAAAATPPPVQLVETAPIETKLGNPALPTAASVWVEMIGGAKKSVDLEEMYFGHWPGEPMGPVIDALGAAAKRGVRVRLILASGMYKTYPQPADSMATLPNVEVRLLDMKQVSGGGIQHSKYFVVDGEQVYEGSQNFDWRSLKHIHEMGARVRNAQVADLFERVFNSDWPVATPIGAAAASPVPAGAPPAAAPLPALPILIVQAPGDTVAVWPSFDPVGHIPDPSLWDRDAVVRLLDGARRDIAIQVYTYGLGRRSERDSTLDLALRRAAARGVHVRIVVCDWEPDNDRITDLQRLSEVPNVETRMISIPEWSGGYIPFARVDHCKYMVVDSLWTWVATSNWEPEYFLSSRNTALTLRNRPIALQAHQSFDASWNSPATRVVRAGETYEKKIHGATPPPGKTAYGK